MVAMTYAAETQETNIRVNIIHPGAVQTAMLDMAYPGGYPEDDSQTPEDLLPFYLELASPECQKHGEIISSS